MAQRKTLTEQQVSLLRWIAEGCPEGVMDGMSHRVSAAALRNRGLVTISGRGSTWAAKITDAGRDYLAQLDGPNPPVPRQANRSVTQQLVDDVIAAGGVCVCRIGAGLRSELVARRAMPKRDLKARVCPRDGEMLAGGDLAVALRCVRPLSPVDSASRSLVGKHQRAAGGDDVGH
jgi:hypothetical protein